MLHRMCSGLSAPTPALPQRGRELNQGEGEGCNEERGPATTQRQNPYKSNRQKRAGRRASPDDDGRTSKRDNTNGGRHEQHHHHRPGPGHRATLAALLAGCGSGAGEDRNTKPAYLGPISVGVYDGGNDDLLTAGLGKTGLGGAAPQPVDPLNPTAAELRRIAIYNNYRAILDISPAGGYGTLYGPNVDARGVVTTGEGKIAGTEFIAYSDDGSGRHNVTMMVQVPASFNPASPCIVTGTSSGSRGVYGAIGSSGEWGLKNGCAVAYTDKGTGSGMHDLQNNTVHLQNGLRADAAAAGNASNFTAALSPAERTAFNAATPNRFAVKHAHSQQNSEKDWGRFTLQAVEFAYFVLNERYGAPSRDGVSRLRTLNPSNTIVIASSVSNGAGAALAAAELDTQGLISGVAVAEPQVQLVPDARLSVRRGNSTLAGTGRPLYDYITLANLLQPCAALALARHQCLQHHQPGHRGEPLRRAQGPGPGQRQHPGRAGGQRHGGAASRGLAARKQRPAGFALFLCHAAGGADLCQCLRPRGVQDNLCGYSFAATAPATAPVPNVPVPASAAALATSFGTGNGVPPTAGVNIVNNASLGGPLLDAASISAGNVQDYNSAGALCLRALVAGNSPAALRVREGIQPVLRTANLQGKPALIVHGRSDTLVPVALHLAALLRPQQDGGRPQQQAVLHRGHQRPAL
jgi:hydroxybutyrate-dimer hydrolase